MFRSYDRPHFKKDESEWLFNAGDASIAKVWEVARATSAAPRYFSKHTIDNGTPGTYIDGGMGCNNPADLMAQEVDAIHGRVPELIISVGTGTKPPMQHGSPQQFNTREHKFLNNARSVFGVLKKLPDIVTRVRRLPRWPAIACNQTQARALSQFTKFEQVPDVFSVQCHRSRHNQIRCMGVH